MLKRFNVGERKWFQLRWETFNIFNHPNFYNPNATVSSGSAFGTITSARDPRFIQFGLKWIY